ncbi:fumarate hydratase C-terminal domain-containing protein [Acetobacteraceae bacterium H6797]|nr:fumarate hydratase C-terminal domain-containing protein [Acetobacteraceae bacterium H6797]
MREMRLPMTPADARSLKLGEMVLLTGEMVITAGLPTHHRMLECVEGKREMPRPLDGQALFHLGSYCEEGEEGFRPLYLNPTTSTRFNPLMPRLIRHFGLTAVGGKGGLDQASAEAMREVGCVYLSFLGGGAPLHTAAIRSVESVHWNDLIAHFRLVTLKVEALGPVTVGIDAHGGNLYSELRQGAAEKMPAIMAKLAEDRAKALG